MAEGEWGGMGDPFVDGDFLKIDVFWAGGQLAANVLMRHMYAQQENVLYKHRRSTCMRDKDLCYTYTCISHRVKIYRGGRALRVCSGCEIRRYMCSIDLCRACMCCVYACTAHFLVARTCVA